jgi:hypothetical protein
MYENIFEIKVLKYVGKHSINLSNYVVHFYFILSLHRAFWRFTYYHVSTNALIISFIV